MDSSRKLGVIEVLREALSIPKGNKKLMLPVILLSFLPRSVLLMGGFVSIYPVILNFMIKLYLLSQKYPNTPQFYGLLIGIKKDAEAFVQVDVIITVASYIVSLFSMILIIYASAMTCSGKQLALKDLFTWIKGSWKGPLLTRIYFTLLYVGYTVLAVCATSILMLNAGGSIGLIAIGVLVALVAHLLYIYLGMVWTMGLVISVLEEGCYGLEALGKAGEFVKRRRLQGFLIALILVVTDGALTGSYGVGIIKVRPLKETRQATGLLVINIILLLELYSHMVYTVFYYECRKSHGKEVEELGDIKYTKVPVATNVDEALP